jgi:TPR repeat protein
MPEAARDPNLRDGGTLPPGAVPARPADERRLRVFISYSRGDYAIADQVLAALETCGFDAVMDRSAISAGEAWEQRLIDLIAAADALVFVLTPSSSGSKWCLWEIDEATKLGKRIFPAVCAPMGGAVPPPTLQPLQLIYFCEHPKYPTAGFGDGLRRLTHALGADIEWLREQTRYLERATEWERRGTPKSRLLVSDEVLDARAWAARRPKSTPEFPAILLDFIHASELEVEARASTDRRQVEELKAAKGALEVALREVERQRNELARLLASATRIIFGQFNGMDGRSLEEAFSVLQMGANVGDVSSMIGLGVLHEKGHGVPRNYDKAREWYEQAVAKGDAIAMLDLGFLYQSGHGVPQDSVTARHWYEKAAEGGQPLAMSNLGSMYLSGEGAARDARKARQWFEKAAEKSDTRAMNALGALYRSGKGGPKDHDKARDWYEKAAEKGDARAMTTLGDVYFHGWGTPRNYHTAREWYEKSAQKGDTTAMRALGASYQHGYGVGIDFAESRRWFERAAENGDPVAMMSVGVLYEKDRVVPRDAIKARAWYQKSVDHGYRPAEAFLQALDARERAPKKSKQRR